jgi:hypothetical protein
MIRGGLSLLLLLLLTGAATVRGNLIDDEIGLPPLARVYDQGAALDAWRVSGYFPLQFASARANCVRHMERKGWKLDMNIPLSDSLRFKSELLAWTKKDRRVLINLSARGPGKTYFQIGEEDPELEEK